jgi:hypothetical protein
MSRNALVRWFNVLAVAAAIEGWFVADASAHPLPGRDKVKFEQLPMLQTPIPNFDGTVQTYGGHDELSTAYGFPTPPNGQIPIYQGKFMADDFADTLSDPVLHVKWWGSYFNDFVHPEMPVNRFLISFESDIPADPSNGFSRPGQPLLNQVVTKAAALTPGSGTYTETFVRGPDSILNESVYEYNAELKVPFPEMKDTVYWLKIVALVNVPGSIQFDPYQPQLSPTPVTQWGWHNRDYTIQNLYASPNVAPGEFVEGLVGAGTPVWHFQDDAVQGDVRITPGAAGFQMPNIFQPQENMLPQLYHNFEDGPGVATPGTVPIGQLSKDLAFAIYTVNIPEPSSCMLIGLAMAIVSVAQRRGR